MEIDSKSSILECRSREINYFDGNSELKDLPSFMKGVKALSSSLVEL